MQVATDPNMSYTQLTFTQRYQTKVLLGNGDLEMDQA